MALSDDQKQENEADWGVNPLQGHECSDNDFLRASMKTKQKVELIDQFF